MFDFMLMADREARKVDHFELGELIVDTAAVNDSVQPYETAVQHPNYKNGKWVIVEMYNKREEAMSGHARWVATMTGEQLPDSLRDVGSSFITELRDAFGDDWRDFDSEWE